jgi:hypothetical protein
MRIPRITKLNLKTIVENLDSIPSSNGGFSDEPKKLSPEEKKKLLEMAGMFEKYGEVFKNETAIMESAKSVSQLCELASTYALNECDELFQTEIVKRDMTNIKKRAVEYSKLAKECYAKTQQLRVAHEDIGNVLSRYYNLQELAEAFNVPAVEDTMSDSPIIQESSSNFKPCKKCGKSLYRGEDCNTCLNK